MTECAVHKEKMLQVMGDDNQIAEDAAEVADLQPSC